MTKEQIDIKKLCQEVCDEFKTLGIKKDVDPRTLKESYNIGKQADGVWFKNTKTSLHEPASVSSLNFNEMPFLKKLTALIDELDAEIQKEGGRIFITENLVYKIKKGTQHTLLFQAPSLLPRYQKLCDEIMEHGLVKDRYRPEETYILSRTASGEWSMSSSHENHSGTKKILNLAKMPLLKSLAMKLGKSDPQFQSNGGRIFVTATRIYRVKNKIEITIPGV